VEVPEGILQLAGGGTDSGILSVRDHRVQQWHSYPQRNNRHGEPPDYERHGPGGGHRVDIIGTTTITGGTLSLGATFRTDGGLMSGGYLTGAGTFITDAAFTWSSGSMTGGSATIISPDAILT